EFKTLANCWNTLGKDVTKNREFVTLVTSAFPTIKEQTLILKELQEARYFDDFSCNPTLHKWICFTCAHPEKVKSLIKSDNSNMPLLEGQLKEKRGKWKFFKRWHTKYFTLSSAALTYSENTYNTVNERTANPSIDLRKIRSVKSLTRGRQSRKSLPKSFEIFTEDEKSYVLKASDRNKAEEWFQCLQIAIAKAQNDRRTQSFKK
uniref:PH domain-containing protein n=1 Tax=Panagrolaimus sp. ES5 TaxID=591445 RepID=A0AC34GFM0_9BILA